MVKRRDLRNIYGALHKVVQEERNIKKEMRSRISVLAGHPETSLKEINELIQKIERKQGQSDENSQHDPAIIEKDLITLRFMKRILEFTDQNPRIKDYFGFDMDNPDEMFSGKFVGKKPEECPMDMDMDFKGHHMGLRVLQRVRRLDKEIEFMKRRLEKAEREIDQFEAIYEKLEESHPEVIRKIEEELQSGEQPR